MYSLQELNQYKLLTIEFKFIVIRKPEVICSKASNLLQ